jgi:hypothetical protein
MEGAGSELAVAEPAPEEFTQTATRPQLLVPHLPASLPMGEIFCARPSLPSWSVPAMGVWPGAPYGFMTQQLGNGGQATPLSLGAADIPARKKRARDPDTFVLKWMKPMHVQLFTLYLQPAFQDTLIGHSNAGGGAARVHQPIYEALAQKFPSFNDPSLMVAFEGGKRVAKKVSDWRAIWKAAQVMSGGRKTPKAEAAQRKIDAIGKDFDKLLSSAFDSGQPGDPSARDTEDDSSDDSSDGAAADAPAPAPAPADADGTGGASASASASAPAPAEGASAPAPAPGSAHGGGASAPAPAAGGSSSGGASAPNMANGAPGTHGGRKKKTGKKAADTAKPFDRLLELAEARAKGDDAESVAMKGHMDKLQLQLGTITANITELVGVAKDLLRPPAPT